MLRVSGALKKTMFLLKDLIFKSWDIRDVKDGLCEFQIIEGTNKGFFTQPILPATFRTDKAQFEARLATTEDYIKKAHNALRSSHSNLEKSQQTERIPVVFPEGVKLTVKPFISAASVISTADTDEPEKVAGKLITCKTDTGRKDAMNQDIYQLHARMTWKVCNKAKATAMAEKAGNGGEQVVDDGFQGL